MDVPSMVGLPSPETISPHAEKNLEMKQWNSKQVNRTKMNESFFQCASRISEIKVIAFRRTFSGSLGRTCCGLDPKSSNLQLKSAVTSWGPWIFVVEDYTTQV